MQFIMFMMTFDLEESLVCLTFSLYFTYSCGRRESVCRYMCVCISVYLKKELYGLNMFVPQFFSSLLSTIF